MSPLKVLRPHELPAWQTSPLPYGHVRLICDDPYIDVVVLLSDEPIRFTGGFGGWDVTARPRQTGMTTWNGQEPLQLTLGLMLDGESAARNLRLLRHVARGDDESPPGVLYVFGVPLPVNRWVIEGVDFGDSIRNGDGTPLRQRMTLVLREYVPPSYLKLRRKALTTSKGKTKVVTSKQGDTPAKVAKRPGVRCQWTDIRALNPKLVNTANQHLKTGTKLRVPVRAEKQHKRSKGRD